MGEDAATRALKKLQTEDRVNQPASATVNQPEAPAEPVQAAATPEVVAPEGTAEKAPSELVLPGYGTPEKALGDFVSPLGLTLPDDLNFTDYELIGTGIRTFKEAGLWIVGDFLNEGIARFGEDMVSQIVDSLGYEEHSLKNAQSVSKAIPMAERRASLTFSHHQAVMGMSAEDRKHWLDLTEENEWTRDELRDQVRAAEVKTSSGRGRPKGSKANTRTSKEVKARAEAMSEIQMAAYVEKTFAPTLANSIEGMLSFAKLGSPILKDIEAGAGMVSTDAKKMIGYIDLVTNHLEKLRAQAEQIAAFEPPKAAKPPKKDKVKKSGKKVKPAKQMAQEAAEA